MRVLITGGTGLIGRALAGSLASDGHEVIVLSRRPESAGGLLAGVRAERWDGRSAQGWGHLAEGAGAIVNLAGQSIAGEGLLSILFRRWTPAVKERILTSRTDAGKAVVQAVAGAARKPGVVIQSSAVGYYGARRDDEIDEQTPGADDYMARVCAAWEESTAPVEGMGVRRVIIRSGVVLDAQGGILPLILLPFRLFVGGRLGSGQQWFPWIHLADEVAAIRFLIDNPNARGPFNLTAPQPLRNADLGRVVGRVLKRPSVFPLPALVLRLVLGEKSMLVLEGQRPMPRRLIGLGFTFRFPQAEAALRDLAK
jgi:hypothetical protein